MVSRISEVHIWVSTQRLEIVTVAGLVTLHQRTVIRIHHTPYWRLGSVKTKIRTTPNIWFCLFQIRLPNVINRRFEVNLQHNTGTMHSCIHKRYSLSRCWCLLTCHILPKYSVIKPHLKPVNQWLLITFAPVIMANTVTTPKRVQHQPAPSKSCANPRFGTSNPSLSDWTGHHGPRAPPSGQMG